MRDAHGVTINTSVMRRVITFARGVPSAVMPTSCMVSGAGEMFGSGEPWFSLRAAGTLWTNLEPVWAFEGEDERTLLNGGTEVVLRFVGTGAAHDLRWEVALQCFPRSTLCRERIVFSVRPGTSLPLEGGGDEPLLVFPAYRFRHGAEARVHDRIVSLAAWGNDLVASPAGVSFDERSLESGTRIGKNLAQNYMYHPAERASLLAKGEGRSGTGPVLLMDTLAGDQGVLFAYEHGAPDGDPEQEYIHLRRENRERDVRVATVYRTGLYARGEMLGGDRRVASAWNVVGWYDGRTGDAGPALLRDYLQDKITESRASRIPHFYYNTWGMQRDEERRGADVRGVLTPDRVVREIDLADRLNIELFVLDDGWQARFGEWVPDRQRYPAGLSWYIDAVRSRGMIPGIWIAPIAADSAAPLAQSHPDWLIKDERGQPVVGRWEKQVFCFASAYREEFITACKHLIDTGIRFFKWDGLDKHLCSSASHGHGSSRQSPEERRAMQGYAMPLLIADAMRQLREYCPDVVVEMDVTEPGRSVGLAVAGEGKYFWMNNGAGAYGDHSTRRGKSTRFIAALYHRYIPPALQTYACYPHNDPVHAAQRANVNSTLIGGWGFWGNLTTLSAGDIGRIGEVVALARRTLPAIAKSGMEVTGAVGGSPEVYARVDDAAGAGQIIAFSGTALAYRYGRGGVRTTNVLAVLRNAYGIHADSVIIPFTFPMPEASREAFIVPNQGAGVMILSSTSWLRDARLVGGDTLRFTPGAPGTHRIRWDDRMGIPTVLPGSGARATITRLPGEGGAGGATLLEIESRTPGSTIEVIREP